MLKSIKISAKENLGQRNQKQHKVWLDRERSKSVVTESKTWMLIVLTMSDMKLFL
jgi:hypothetical protein